MNFSELKILNTSKDSLQIPVKAAEPLLSTRLKQIIIFFQATEKVKPPPDLQRLMSEPMHSSSHIFKIQQPCLWVMLMLQGITSKQFTFNYNYTDKKNKINLSLRNVNFNSKISRHFSSWLIYKLSPLPSYCFSNFHFCTIEFTYLCNYHSFMLNYFSSPLRSLENDLCRLLMVPLWTQTPFTSPSPSCSKYLHLNLILAIAMQDYNKQTFHCKQTVFPLLPHFISKWPDYPP